MPTGRERPDLAEADRRHRGHRLVDRLEQREPEQQVAQRAEHRHHRDAGQRDPDPPDGSHGASLAGRGSSVETARGQCVLRLVIRSWRAVGAGRLEEEAGAAAGQVHRAHVAQRPVGVRRADHRGGGRDQPVAGVAGQPGDLVPVVRGGRPSVVQHGEGVLGQDRGDPGAAGVPGAGRRGQHGAVPGPGQAVVAGEVGRGHPVLLAGLVERVAADPHPPAVGADQHDRVLHRDGRVAGEHHRAGARRETLDGVRVERLHPPVLGVGRGAGQVEPPAAVRPAHQGGPLERLGPERRRGAPRSTGSKCSPSSERATTTLTPRPCSADVVPGRPATRCRRPAARWRAPAQLPGAEPGAGTTRWASSEWAAGAATVMAREPTRGRH